MDIAVEISLYPLDRNFVPPIEDFIARLQRHTGLRVVRNSMSTQIVGEYDAVFAALHAEAKPTFERAGKAVFVMKLLGALPAFDAPASV